MYMQHYKFSSRIRTGMDAHDLIILPAFVSC